MIADALSKSATLARDEREAAAAFEVVEPFARHLAEKGRRPRDRREILKQVGQALLVRQRVSGGVAVEEKPDVLWDRPDLERLYARLEDEYELKERATALHRKLEVLGDTAQALTDLIDTERGLRLELIIVLLIVFEIVITFYQMFTGAPGALRPRHRGLEALLRRHPQPVRQLVAEPGELALGVAARVALSPAIASSSEISPRRWASRPGTPWARITGSIGIEVARRRAPAPRRARPASIMARKRGSIRRRSSSRSGREEELDDRRIGERPRLRCAVEGRRAAGRSPRRSRAPAGRAAGRRGARSAAVSGSRSARRR